MDRLQHRKNAAADNPNLGAERIGDNSIRGGLESLQAACVGLDIDVYDMGRGAATMARVASKLFQTGEMDDLGGDIADDQELFLMSIWMDGFLTAKLHSQIQAEEERKE